MSRTLVLHEPVYYTPRKDGSSLGEFVVYAEILPGPVDEDYLRGELGALIVDKMLEVGILTVRDEPAPQ